MRKLQRLLPITLALLFVIGMLSPLAQLLRTQNPFVCFNLTQDESYFLQAIYNRAIGHGFAVHGQPKPFHAGLSIGPWMAIGAAGVHRFSHLAWPQSARLWVHFCFYGILGMISAEAWIRTRSWSAVVLTLGIFGLCMKQFTMGPYVTYGILGELPAALLAWAGLLALDRRRPVLAGVCAVLAVSTKPTFSFLPLCMVLASLTAYRSRSRDAWILVASLFLGSILWLESVAWARGESLFEYLSLFLHQGLATSLQETDGSRLSKITAYYRQGQKLACTVSVGAVILFFAEIRRHFRRRIGLLDDARGWRPLSAGELSAILFFIAGGLFYLISNRKPLDKHWFVFLSTAAVVVTWRAAFWISEKLRAFPRVFSDETIGITLLAAGATWLVNVPSLEKRKFEEANSAACPVKEQHQIDQLLVGLRDHGQVRPDNLAGVVESPAFSDFLIELGWNPSYLLRPESDPPRWIAGSTSVLFPEQSGCHSYWKGSQYSLLECTGK